MEDIEHRIGKDWKDFIPMSGVFNYKGREAQELAKSRHKGNIGDIRGKYFAGVYWTQVTGAVSIGLANGYGLNSLIDLL